MAAAPVQRLTENLIIVPINEATAADPTLIYDKDRYSYFRGCPGSQGHIFMRKKAAELSQSDIEALNLMCDSSERPLNRRVKKLFAASLKQYFGEMAIQVFEFGCGKFPLARYFADAGAKNVSYHGIERDRNYILQLHKMNIPASDWAEVMTIQTPQDMPSICTSVYALHFMVNAKLPRRIEKLTNQLGFFVGNFYSDPSERDTSIQKTKLGKILAQANMPFIRIQDPRSHANEFWVISPSKNVTNMHNYADVLQDLLPKKKGPPSLIA